MGAELLVTIVGIHAQRCINSQRWPSADTTLRQTRILAFNSDKK